MIITLSDTNAAKISSAMLSARRSAGGPASGMVLTLIIVSTEDEYPAALEAAMAAGREHPCRILLVVTGNGRHTASLDAEVRIGEGTSGEVIVVRMRGPLADHPASVIRPLLLPDSPVVVWWPGTSTSHKSAAGLAELSNRRITDAAAAKQPRRDLARRAEQLVPGDTDLAWTRLTPWRTLLAAALDQFPAKVTAVRVEAERGNPSAELLAAWLGMRLKLQVHQSVSDGPGITAVRLTTKAGDLAITRADGLVATYTVPGQPDRRVALKRRPTSELIAEELRRMDHDVVYEQTLQAFTRRNKTGSTAKKTAGKKTAGKKVAAQKASSRSTSSGRSTKKASSGRSAKKTAKKVS
jgi:glucose-6-phosphate dehydrogenase assembly protein OpcA